LTRFIRKFRPKLFHKIDSRKTIEGLNDRNFGNTLPMVQEQLALFNAYRNCTKPPKLMDKGNLEVLLFTLQSKMRANNKAPYFPKEGKTLSDINKAWEQLERAEHGLELALRQQLMRLQRLEQLAAKFNRKAGMREAWLSENQRLVDQAHTFYHFILGRVARLGEFSHIRQLFTLGSFLMTGETQNFGQLIPRENVVY
jgi:hypothetical protein